MGCGLGLFVGDKVGSDVGSGVGLGLGVGLAVGEGAAVLTGAFLGAGVGDRVGVGIGVVVGKGVGPPAGGGVASIASPATSGLGKTKFFINIPPENTKTTKNNISPAVSLLKFLNLSTLTPYILNTVYYRFTNCKVIITFQYCQTNGHNSQSCQRLSRCI